MIQYVHVYIKLLRAMDMLPLVRASHIHISNSKFH
jgi:hypothetical protein